MQSLGARKTVELVFAISSFGENFVVYIDWNLAVVAMQSPRVIFLESIVYALADDIMELGLCELFQRNALEVHLVLHEIRPVTYLLRRRRTFNAFLNQSSFMRLTRPSPSVKPFESTPSSGPWPESWSRSCLSFQL